MSTYINLIIVGAIVVGSGVLVMERQDPRSLPTWRATVLVSTLVSGCLLGLVGILGTIHELLRR